MHSLSSGSGDVHSDPKDPSLPVAREILSYFLRNPNAADSLTEIARWRLMQEMVRRSVETTEAALNWLVSEGYVREETRRGTERIFQFNPARREDAESFLQKELQNQDFQP
jgi:hypothetical protein